MAVARKRPAKAAAGGRGKARPTPATARPGAAKPAPKKPAPKKPAPKKPAPKKPAPKRPAAAPAAAAGPAARTKLVPAPLVDRDRTRLLREHARFGSATITLKDVGPLYVTTGELVTCDPFIVDGAALTRKVAPGSYPVTLTVATFDGDKGKGDQRVAAATVRLGDGVPVRWEVATFAGVPRKKGGEPGYPVDAGTGCFMDVAAQAAIKAERSPWPTPSQKALEQQLLTDHYTHTWAWADYQPDAASPANCVAFMSGWGDGIYSSYWGLDETGTPACLMTDFDVFTDEDWSNA